MSAPARHLADWLPDATPALNAAIVRRALTDVGLLEMPPGSNRSPRIDEYNRAVGSDVGSYWCASALSAWFREAGARTPPTSAASCDAWLSWATRCGYLSSRPVEGAAVLYGVRGDASHCGVVVRLTPLRLTVEGNTSLSRYDRNGYVVTLKRLEDDRVLGYVHPTPIAQAA